MTMKMFLFLKVWKCLFPIISICVSALEMRKLLLQKNSHWKCTVFKIINIHIWEILDVTKCLREPLWIGHYHLCLQGYLNIMFTVPLYFLFFSFSVNKFYRIFFKNVCICIHVCFFQRQIINKAIKSLVQGKRPNLPLGSSYLKIFQSSF